MTTLLVVLTTTCALVLVATLMKGPRYPRQDWWTTPGLQRTPKTIACIAYAGFLLGALTTITLATSSSTTSRAGRIESWALFVAAVIPAYLITEVTVFFWRGCQGNKAPRPGELIHGGTWLGPFPSMAGALVGLHILLLGLYGMAAASGVLA